MFFIVNRTERISLSPEDFGGDIKEHLFQLLKKKVEGKCSGRWGYTVFVMPDASNWKTSDGLLDIDTGHAVYEINFDSVVFRPYRNEVLMAIVSDVNSEGIFCRAGPAEIFVSLQNMPQEYQFNNSSGVPCFEHENNRIKVGSRLRLKICGLRMSSETISGVGTLKEDYLGLMD